MTLAERQEMRLLWRLPGCIENVFGAIRKSYRTGGDEFAVVVFDPEEDRKHCLRNWIKK